MNPAGCSVVASLSLLLAAATAMAQDAPLERQRLGLPLDFSQGAIPSRSNPTPYTLSLRAVVPAFRFGEGGVFRVGPALSLTHTNPGWEGALGVRAAVRLLEIFLPENGLLLIAEAAWGTGDRVPLTAALVVDVDGVVRFGPWVTREVEGGEWLVEASIGTDLISLFGVLFPGEPEQPEF